jgi:hypothetical protein
MIVVKVRGDSLEKIAEKTVKEIQDEMESRAYRGANELRNSALLVLRGQRSGRSYRVPGTKRRYTASAPGEPPAVRTGTFRNSWQPRTYAFGDSYFSIIDSEVFYADWLENGTPGGQMAPRPHHERILKDAEPKIQKIYDEPYF